MNTQRITVKPQDLPLYCPGEGKTLWNQHPRVFLPIEADSEYRCPYCSRLYYLDGAPEKHFSY